MHEVRELQRLNRGQESVGSNAATVAMAKIVKELGVPADIIARMVVAPPDQMVWLTPNNAMGTTLTGKPVQTPTAKTPSQLTHARSDMQAPAPTTTTWENIVSGVVSLSAKQHNGKPLFNRVCQPELKVCSTAIMFNGNDGKEYILRSAEDSSGKLVAREICEFNQFGDVRLCVDFDTTHRDMKDATGNWVKIDDR